MENKKESEIVTMTNKRLSEVKEEEETKSSKHSSIVSETDFAISETSISEAVVESISTESFVVLEAGYTVRLTMPFNESTKTGEQETKVSKSEVIEKGAENSDSVTDTTKTDMATSQQSDADRSDTNGCKKDNVIATENEQSTTTDEKADKSLDSDEDKLKHEQLVTQKNIIDVNTSGKTENGKISDSSNDSDKDSTTDNTDRSPPTTNSEQSNRLPDTTDVQTCERDNLKEDERTDELGNRVSQHATIKSDANGQGSTEAETTVPDNESKPDTTVVATESKSEITASVSESTEVVPESSQGSKAVNLSPEQLAVLAQKLTTSLAQQLVDGTSKIAHQMIGASNNTLTMYNGATLELADVDYFVIYKSEDPKPEDGISFIARMELGTNSITKVIPVGPLHAWVSYAGGGVKLVDLGTESVINKIEIQGIETIATSDMSFLFTTNLKSFSVIEKMHIAGEGSSGSAQVIKLHKCRIACLTMANSGKNLMLCIERQHSCLCIPGKSEILVQIYELNGKRVKEFKPKVNGQITPTKGFPIVMCENTNRDICIATYNSAEHTCAVEVYDKNMERRFVYDGDKALSPRFMCEDICSDNNGNILMLDNSLKSIHIVSPDGKLIKLISTRKFQIANPKCINIDINGRLWIGQGPPAQMIILEYTL
jgi:hypothetical protein